LVAFVALLRAVNVGGISVLPMKELASLCSEAGLEAVRTYIQSGNVVFQSTLPEAEIGARLASSLARRMGKPIDVMIRTAAELRSVLDQNPFPGGSPAQVVVMFLSRPAPKDLADAIVIPGSEEVRVAGRHIYIHYPDGIGRSKLKLPPALVGTARNLNTVGKLVAMAETGA
jgi:uncharacterized protein (DUF1697 family)